MGVLDPGSVCEVYLGDGTWGPAIVVSTPRADSQLQLQVIDRGAVEWHWPSETRPLRNGPAWQTAADCAEISAPDEFHPAEGSTNNWAKGICHGCDVRSDCLAYSLAYPNLSGIWGGLSEIQRRRLRRTVKIVQGNYAKPIRRDVS